MRQTSIDAYRTIAASGLLSKLRLSVYKWLYENGPATAKEVAIGCKENSDHNLDFGGTYTCRLTELREQGCIRELGKTVCKYTGRNVILWDVTGDLPKKPVKKLSNKRKLEIAEQIIFKNGLFSVYEEETKKAIE